MTANALDRGLARLRRHTARWPGGLVWGLSAVLVTGLAAAGLVLTMRLARAVWSLLP